jgi:hypothetical protein
MTKSVKAKLPTTPALGSPKSAFVINKRQASKPKP